MKLEVDATCSEPARSALEGQSQAPSSDLGCKPAVMCIFLLSHIATYKGCVLGSTPSAMLIERWSERRSTSEMH